MSLRIESNSEPIPGYRLIDRIGHGGFGEVWRAEAPGGLMKAIKVIHGDLRSIDADGAKHAEQELKALKRLQGIRHPYLLSIERYDVIEGRVLIVSELADCNLWDRFREHRAQNRPGIPRSEVLRYMVEAAEVLDLMNTQYQLQHLDIKPQNLFLVHNHVKVADFGLVKDLEGMRGQITGGVTPVYAAPETFDSIVTRFCDQYSLAIVYQELLTGVRPFDGTSGQKLLMQHLREPPNLGPLPPSDRPIVGRALSKKPEDRFPSCLEFVQALEQSGSNASPMSSSAMSAGARTDTPVGTARSMPPLPPMGTSQRVEPLPPMETPKTQLNFKRDESASMLMHSLADAQAAIREAPDEVTGDGCLIPALIIGLGQSGMETIRDLRQMMTERYGGVARLPQIKLLYVDTDSETLHAATSTCGLHAEEVIPARLNRPAHYLKPRRNGRNLIDGWFDPQTLYKIPRNPITGGIRALGRLAYLDHYRSIADKISASIESCTNMESLNGADRVTRLRIRSNRPRVYIVAGLAGGTGSGMLLDVAYTARHKLRQLGYLDPEVIGLLSAPNPDRNVKGPGLANTYAALREIHHYSQPDTSFSAMYEERDGKVNDPSPPFTRCFILPYGVNKSGEAQREPASRRAANFLFGNLLTPLGRSADDARWRRDDFGAADVSLGVFGQAGYVWPRQALVGRAARWLSASVLHRWTASDPDVIGGYVKNWLTQRLQIEQISADQIVNRLQRAGEAFLGQAPEALFTNESHQFVTKGWFAKEPDPAKLWQSLGRLQSLVGMPDERQMQRTVGQLEQALDDAADAAVREYGPKFLRLATTLLEHPDYRLVGAEAAIVQAQAMIDSVLAQYEPMSIGLGSQAIDAFNLIQQYLNADRGQKRPNSQAIAEAVRSYPTWRYQSLVLRQACRVFQTVRTQLADQLRELQFCRQRLEDITNGIKKDGGDQLPISDRTLLPAGVVSAEAAVAALQATVTADDIRNFDKKLQVQIEQEFNALFNVCLSSVNMLGNLQTTILEQARTFLSNRLGEANLDQMFFSRFPDTNRAAQAIQWLNDQAEPPMKSFGPDAQETVIVAGPDGLAADRFKQLADFALQTPPTDYVPSVDQVYVYRELTNVPLSALPQLGLIAEDAYNAAIDAHGGPHIRIDVPTWQDVEVG